MENTQFEKAFDEAKKMFRNDDRRTAKWRWDAKVSRNEFLSIVQDQAEAWFTERIKKPI